jgi:hypothetical protein
MAAPRFSNDKAREQLSHEPYKWFESFVSGESDRFDSLDAILRSLRLQYSIVKIGGSRHFFVTSAVKSKPPAVFLAHYDAAPGSSGANDNASGVFVLLAAALELNKKPGQPWLVIFTDKEEISAGEGLRAQGSFLLAKGLKGTGFADADFYVFDACGRGDTLIISTIADHLLKNEAGLGAAQIQKKLHDLRQRAITAAIGSHFRDRHILLATPFSDDAGFLRAGLAAQTITILPKDEAASFTRLSRVHPEYIGALVNREHRDGLDTNQIPLTWRLINSPDDKLDGLNPEILPLVSKFAVNLAVTK